MFTLYRSTINKIFEEQEEITETQQIQEVQNKEHNSLTVMHIEYI